MKFGFKTKFSFASWCCEVCHGYVKWYFWVREITYLCRHTPSSTSDHLQSQKQVRAATPCHSLLSEAGRNHPLPWAPEAVILLGLLYIHFNLWQSPPWLPLSLNSRWQGITSSLSLDLPTPWASLLYAFSIWRWLLGFCYEPGSCRSLWEVRPWATLPQLEEKCLGHQCMILKRRLPGNINVWEALKRPSSKTTGEHRAANGGASLTFFWEAHLGDTAQKCATWSRCSEPGSILGSGEMERSLKLCFRYVDVPSTK